MASLLRAYCERSETSTGIEGGAPIRFVISSEGIKRDGLNLVVSGVRLDNYRRNPIVTWAHDLMGQRLPIGRADVVVDPGGERLFADISFDQGDEFARQVERKYRDGYLHAVSVNWTTLNMNGRDITDWELLEIAAVPVPGDPDALMQRQYQALRELVSPDRSGEDPWRDLAKAMAEIFLPGSDDTDEERERRYRALLPRYRRMGKTPPEFVSKNELAALSAAEIRGLFLEGEESFYGAQVEARSGAVLSKRNLDDLRQAVELISGVLERAQKTLPGEDEPGDKSDPEDERAAADAALRNVQLESIFQRLLSLGGHNG